jgi:hypothetical protein
MGHLKGVTNIVKKIGEVGKDGNKIFWFGKKNAKNKKGNLKFLTNVIHCLKL